MSSQWKNDKSVQTWILPKSCRVFSAKFDEIQQNLQAISCMDELLAGVVVLWYTGILLLGVNYVIDVCKDKKIVYTICRFML